MKVQESLKFYDTPPKECREGRVTSGDSPMEMARVRVSKGIRSMITWRY